VSKLACVLEAEAPIAVVRLDGQLDFATAVDVRTILHKTLAVQPTAIVVDMTGVTVVEDLVLTVFAAFARAAAEWPGCPVLLGVVDPVVRDAIDRMAVSRTTSVYGGRTAALAAAEAVRAPFRFRQRLGSTTAAPLFARSMVSDACEAWELDQLRDEAELLITEMVTNAMRHVGGELELVITLRDRFVHLSVRDGSRKMPVRTLPDPETGEGGRGLLVMDAVASGWGSTALPTGKAVWATLRIRR